MEKHKLIYAPGGVKRMETQTPRPAEVLQITPPLPPSAPFPLHALPRMLRDTIMAADRMVQSPLGVTINSVFATVAYACQHLVDVRLPWGAQKAVPVSMFFCSGAESGDRKSSMDDLIMTGVECAMNQLEVKAKREQATYDLRLEHWEE